MSSKDSSLQSRLPSLLPFNSDRPVLRGMDATGEHFDCACGMRLIENYHPSSYLSVSIKCPSCWKNVETPGLEEGEILPRRVVNLGNRGGYGLGDTLHVPFGAVLTCDPEIERVQASTAPRPPGTVSDLNTESGIDDACRKYDELTSSYSSEVAKLARYQANGQSGSSALPFAWAVDVLRKHLRAGNLDYRDDVTWSAQLLLNLFDIVHKTWAHHPRFKFSMRGLSGSYRHHHAIFMSAAMIHSRGVAIGFPNIDNKGIGNPDMYTRTSSRTKMHLEVKSPRELEWTPERPEHHLERAAIEKVLQKSLKDSQDQIDRVKSGTLIVSSTRRLDTKLAREAIQGVIQRKGRDRSSVERIAMLLPVLGSREPHREFTDLRFQLITEENEFYVE